MQRTVEERECNNCGLIVQQQDWVGGSSFHGWFYVEKKSGSCMISEQEGPWDFCSEDCLIQFVKNPELRLVEVYFMDIPVGGEFAFQGTLHRVSREGYAGNMEIGVERAMGETDICILTKQDLRRYKIDDIRVVRYLEKS